MEVACGEYGDNVPRLVVAEKAIRMEPMQRIRRLTNCEKDLLDMISRPKARFAEVESSTVCKRLDDMDDINAWGSLKETAILDDDDEWIYGTAAAAAGLMKVDTTNKACAAAMMDDEQQVGLQ